MDYREFLERKRHSGSPSGIDPGELPGWLFDFQSSLVEWSLRQGRAAVFADCGLGKTPIQLVWSDHIARATNGRVLILTPLAVSGQTVREGEKFGIEVSRSQDGTTSSPITVTNYERLDRFDPGNFAGVVCDESSILKSFDGARRSDIIRFMRKIPYRLLATATAAPNDFTELGSSSEALGEMGLTDMLGRFFVNDQNNIATGRAYAAVGGGARTWRFKGHAETPFWRWVCSWARACRKPSDLGFEDGRFVLPDLIEREHVVKARRLAEGMLFSLPAQGLAEEREERRRTINERCEMVAELVDHYEPAVVWCHLNDEGDLLASLIPGAVQVSGSDSDEAKEDAYRGFADGSIRVLITKPKIGAWGLNWQHCAHVVTFASHSFEQLYQSVRRCWRFGQDRPVTVDLVVTEGEAGIRENLRRKQVQADRMFEQLVTEMNSALRIEKRTIGCLTLEVPPWLMLKT